MKKLRLIKPWRLRAVRQKLDTSYTVYRAIPPLQVPVGIMPVRSTSLVHAGRLPLTPVAPVLPAPRA